MSRILDTFEIDCYDLDLGDCEIETLERALQTAQAEEGVQ